MMVNGLTNSYALVLFNIATKKNSLQVYYDTVLELLHVFNKHPELNDFLNDTAISKEERKQLVNDLFKDKIDDSILYFLWVVIDFNRARELVKIVKAFLAMCQKHLNISYVLVTSASALDSKEVADLKTALSNNLSLEQIHIHNHVDPAVIGGLRIKTHAVTIDDTIKSKLNAMKSNVYGSKGEQ